MDMRLIPWCNLAIVVAVASPAAAQTGGGGMASAGCPQRSAWPSGRALIVDERERRVSALTFAGD